MKPIRKYALAVSGAAILATLAACATPTPYKPAAENASPRSELAQGYSEQKIESNRYRLKFAGNTSTSRETVEDYMLYRAAELALDNGFDWFTLTSRNTAEDKTTSTTYRDPFGRPFYGSMSWRYYYGNRWGPWGFGYSAFDEVDTREYKRYEATAEVVFGKGAKPADDLMAFDAREVKANLESRILRPVPKP